MEYPKHVLEESLLTGTDTVCHKFKYFHRISSKMYFVTVYTHVGLHSIMIGLCKLKQ